MKPTASTIAQAEQPLGEPVEANHSVMAARAVYALLIGALAVADKEEASSTAEHRAMIALAADAYFPLTGLEKPRWIDRVINTPAVDAEESKSDRKSSLMPPHIGLRYQFYGLEKERALWTRRAYLRVIPFARTERS